MGGIHSVAICSRCGRHFDTGSYENYCYHCDVILDKERDIRSGYLTAEQIVRAKEVIERMEELLKQY